MPEGDGNKVHADSRNALTSVRFPLPGTRESETNRNGMMARNGNDGEIDDETAVFRRENSYEKQRIHRGLGRFPIYQYPPIELEIITASTMAVMAA